MSNEPLGSTYNVKTVILADIFLSLLWMELSRPGPFTWISSNDRSRFAAGCCYCTVSQSCLTLCDPMDCSTPGFPVYHHLPELAQTHVLSWWYYSTISSSVMPFSSCLQSFPASGSFPVSWLFASGGQITGASVSVLSSEYSGVISFRIDLFAVQGTFKSLLQHDSSKVLALII